MYTESIEINLDFNNYFLHFVLCEPVPINEIVVDLSVVFIGT